MHNLKVITVSIALIASVIVATPALSAEPAMDTMKGHISIIPSEIKWSDAPSIGPGAKIAVLEGDPKQAAPFTMRLKLPPNFKIATHTHPADERVTVLSGTFHLGIGDKPDSAKAVAYPVGGLTVIPSGVSMFAFTTDEEAVLQVNGVGPWGIEYLNPTEDQRKN